jgi:hypothetical protein
VGSRGGKIGLWRFVGDAVAAGVIVALGVLPTVGCDEAGPAADAGGTADTGTVGCSQMHRQFSKWQGNEIAECGPDVTGLLELLPLGERLLLAHHRFGMSTLWQLTADGAPFSENMASPYQDGQPPPVDQLKDFSVIGLTLLPGTPRRLFSYNPREPQFRLYTIRDEDKTVGGAVFPEGPPTVGWPQTPASGQRPYWRSLGHSPWGHEFIGLEDNHLLDRDLGDGSTRLWQVVENGSPTVEIRSEPFGTPRDDFRRGHRIVRLGPGRLLSWIPRPCANGGETTGACYSIWQYTLAPFDLTLVHEGSWPQIDAGYDILADETNLFVWTRATGALEARRLDPLALDPLRRRRAGPRLRGALAGRAASRRRRPGRRRPLAAHLRAARTPPPPRSARARAPAQPRRWSPRPRPRPEIGRPPQPPASPRCDRARARPQRGSTPPAPPLKPRVTSGAVNPFGVWGLSRVREVIGS